MLYVSVVASSIPPVLHLYERVVVLVLGTDNITVLPDMQEMVLLYNPIVGNVPELYLNI